MLSKKRKLPRHVDGRIMVGPIELKKLIVSLIPCFFFAFLILSNGMTPLKFFFATIIFCIILCLSCEVNKKETILDIIKDIIKYKLRGTLYYERSCKNVSDYKRCIRNKIK